MVARITFEQAIKAGFRPTYPGDCHKSPEATVVCKRKMPFKVRMDSCRQRPLLIALNPPSHRQIQSQQQPQRFVFPQKRVRKSVRIVESRNQTHAPKSGLQQPQHQQKSLSWYNQNEYIEFKRDANKTLDAYAKVQGDLSLLDLNKHCLRGLEAHISKDILKLRKSAMRSAIHAVLVEQARLKATSARPASANSNAAAISAVSRMLSKGASEYARSMGSLDDAMRRC